MGVLGFLHIMARAAWAHPETGSIAAMTACGKLRYSLETKIGFANLFGATFEVAPAVPSGGLGTETGTGRVRCLVPILLLGGFGYAHL
jgi:hypothetical protein